MEAGRPVEEGKSESIFKRILDGLKRLDLDKSLYEGKCEAAIRRAPEVFQCFLTPGLEGNLIALLAAVEKGHISEPLLTQFEILSRNRFHLVSICKVLGAPAGFQVVEQLAQSVLRTNLDILMEAKSVNLFFLNLVPFDQVTAYLSPEADALRKDPEGSQFLSKIICESSESMPWNLLFQRKNGGILKTIRVLGIEKAKLLATEHGVLPTALALSMANGDIENLDELLIFCKTLGGSADGERGENLDRAFQLFQKNKSAIVSDPATMGRRVFRPKKTDPRLSDEVSRELGLAVNPDRYFWFDTGMADWDFSVLNASRSTWAEEAQSERRLAAIVVARWDHNGALQRIGREVAPLLPGYQLVCMETEDEKAALKFLQELTKRRGRLLDLLSVFSHANPHKMCLGGKDTGLIESAWFTETSGLLAQGAVVAPYGCSAYVRRKKSGNPQEDTRSRYIPRPRVNTQGLKQLRPDLLFLEKRGTVRSIDWHLDAEHAVVGATYA